MLGTEAAHGCGQEYFCIEINEYAMEAEKNSTGQFSRGLIKEYSLEGDQNRAETGALFSQERRKKIQQGLLLTGTKSQLVIFTQVRKRKQTPPTFFTSVQLSSLKFVNYFASQNRSYYQQNNLGKCILSAHLNLQVKRTKKKKKKVNRIGPFLSQQDDLTQMIKMELTCHTRKFSLNSMTSMNPSHVHPILLAHRETTAAAPLVQEQKCTNKIMKLPSVQTNRNLKILLTYKCLQELI